MSGETEAWRIHHVPARAWVNCQIASTWVRSRLPTDCDGLPADEGARQTRSRIVGGRWAFAVLAPGPAFGLWAMQQLERSPAAAKLAGRQGMIGAIVGVDLANATFDL